MMFLRNADSFTTSAKIREPAFDFLHSSVMWYPSCLLSIVLCYALSSFCLTHRTEGTSRPSRPLDCSLLALTRFHIICPSAPRISPVKIIPKTIPVNFPPEIFLDLGTLFFSTGSLDGVFRSGFSGSGFSGSGFSGSGFSGSGFSGSGFNGLK